MFQSALVALKPERSDSVISVSVEFAKSHGWELGGLSVVDVERVTHGEAVPLGASAFKADRDTRHVAAARRIAQTVSHELASVCEVAGVRCDALVSEGDTVGELTRMALAFDLLICGHTPGGNASDRSLLHGILKHNARPVFVIPRGPAQGSSVLLAYDGSFQAGRVMATLVHSGLLTDRQLHIVSLHAEFSTAAAHLVSATSFLRRHGIEATSHPEVLVKPPAEQLLEAAQRFDAGLIAMGAFGKNSVREFFFGSVTHRLLETLPVPILLDH